MTDLNQVRQLAETLRELMRSIDGLPLEEPHTITDWEDPRQGTRLDEVNVYAHSAMESIAQRFPRLRMLKIMAEQEKAHFISEDGEQRKEEILIRRPTSESNVSLTMPQIATAPVQVPQPNAPVEQKKKHFWSRGK